MTVSAISGGWRRIAFALALCALLVRVAVPAGWMPQASARGVLLGWCSGATHAVPAAASALLADALGKQKPVKPAAEEHCSFAAAAQPFANAAAVRASLAPHGKLVAAYPPLTLFPGRGLAAPPPRSTGPPLLA